MPPPVVSTIAGSDPSGSSGIQADLPTFAALGAHGTSVVTVVTAQDSTGVKAFHELPLDLVEAQLDHLLADLPPAATKTGLLRSPQVVALVAARAATGRLGALVVDPVMVDSAGRPIVSGDTADAYRRLAARADVLTPNRWEAEMLTGCQFEEEPGDAAAALLALGCPLVVVTGGRGDEPEVTDWVISAGHATALRGPRVGQEAIRGTGCTFSAALAAYLAAGSPGEAAAAAAHGFVQAQLARQAYLRLGAGRPGVPHSVAGPPPDVPPTDARAGTGEQGRPSGTV